MRKSVSGLLAALGFVAAGACVPQTGGGAPAPNYGEIAPSTMASAGGLGACLSDEEAAAIRGRSLQQQLATATLLCKGAAGERTLGDRYNQFINRFQPDWPTNVATVRSVAAARRMDFNALVTDMAN